MNQKMKKLVFAGIIGAVVVISGVIVGNNISKKSVSKGSLILPMGPIDAAAKAASSGNSGLKAPCWQDPSLVAKSTLPSGSIVSSCGLNPVLISTAASAPKAFSNPDGSLEWPTHSGDLNIQRGAIGGPGTMFIHNGTNQRVYAKLCIADGSPCTGVRHVLIMPHSYWPVTSISEGGYQLRVRTIDSPFFGAASDAFELSSTLSNAHVYLKTKAPNDTSLYIIPMKSLNAAEF